jgi:hypothetical protein
MLLASGVAVSVLSSSATAGASGLTWSVVPSPDSSPTQADELNGVSCSSPSACIAVGLTYTPESYPLIRTSLQTLIESWNGSVWSIVPSPDTSPTQDNDLKAVSCSSPSACTAVGFSSNSQTLIETWNGSAWSIVPSPNTSPTQENLLNAVSCSGPSACVAVGDAFTDGADQTLIESWNGSAWSIVPSPNTSSTQADDLGGVSCSSPSACTAVGSYFNSQTLIESWNGSVWSIVPSPNASQISLLSGVSCSSSSACTAVGFTGNDQTFIESGTQSATASMVIPSNGAAISGTGAILDASASAAAGVAAVRFVLTGGSYDQSVIGTATPTIYGYLFAWNTTGVPGATYALQSQVTDNDGNTAVSPAITVTVDNTAPTTSVVIPTTGTALSGTQALLDASASASYEVGISSVRFVLTGGSYNKTVIATATATLYGYIAKWNTTGVPDGTYALQSLATDRAGNTAYSSAITVEVQN